MFSDQTNQLVDSAMQARQAVRDARTEARSKTDARTSAQQEETTANQALQAATAEHTRASQAALKAVQDELNQFDADQLAALQRGGQTPQRGGQQSGSRR